MDGGRRRRPREGDLARAKGTLTTKHIDGRDYYYLQWRDGDTIHSQYVAPVSPASNRWRKVYFSFKSCGHEFDGHQQTAYFNLLGFVWNVMDVRQVGRNSPMTYRSRSGRLTSRTSKSGECERRVRLYQSFLQQLCFNSGI